MQSGIRTRAQDCIARNRNHRYVWRRAPATAPPWILPDHRKDFEVQNISNKSVDVTLPESTIFQIR
jgi:hypothetical protein